MIDILGITCSGLAPFIRVIKYLFVIIKYLIPIILIVLITVDFFKAFVANDDKQMKDATNKSIKRIVYALIVFLVPTLVSLLFGIIGSRNLGSDELGSLNDGISCYNSVKLR